MNIKGLTTSKGLAMGTAYLLAPEVLPINNQTIDSAVQELERYDRAVQESIDQLKSLIETTRSAIGEKEAQIFEAHVLMLEDEAFHEDTKALIQETLVNACYAVEVSSKAMQAIFSAMDNVYMKERAADIGDLSKRLIKNMMGLSNEISLPQDAILFCEDLEPSDTAKLDPSVIAGFVTEKGGLTSHSAIIAQSLGIPAITGIRANAFGIVNGMKLLMDAENGELILNPEQEAIRDFAARIAKRKAGMVQYESTQFLPGMTQDKILMEIAANIADSSKAEKALTLGADGVGLFRTEFLYMNRESLPSVEEQFEAYKTALTAFGRKPMVIRTFDIGGDKQVPYLNMDPEMNPFLGYRAIRISLDRLEMFKDQLKALYMASPYGNLKIMFPMISCVEEVLEIKKVIQSVKEELDDQNIPYSAVEIGIMVEIPAVVMDADKFAKHVDFFSIGTNDLLQYTIAVDRMNEKLAHLYNWYHPSLLRMIQLATEAAHRAGIWIGICGEAASDPLLLPYYVGLGIDELSMSYGKVPEIKWQLSHLNREACGHVVEKVLAQETSADVLRWLKRFDSAMNQ